MFNKIKNWWSNEDFAGKIVIIILLIIITGFTILKLNGIGRWN